MYDEYFIIIYMHACNREKKEFEKFPFPWLNKSGKRDASEEGEEREDDKL